MRLLWAMFGIMMIKFLVSNLLYSFLMGRNKTAHIYIYIEREKETYR